jgi:DNA uptake protein ComE-like DNA-binding protein
MTLPAPTRRLLPAILLVASLAAACSGSSGANATTSPSTAAAPSAPSASSNSAGATQATSSGTVNANTATVDELAATFSAAGISNADRWAREVAEYRPYDDAPAWTKLRHELAKYNIDPAVLEKIVAVLVL